MVVVVQVEVGKGVVMIKWYKRFFVYLIDISILEIYFFISRFIFKDISLSVFNFLIIDFIYFIILPPLLLNGSTIGMKLFGIKIVNYYGEKIDILDALKRYIFIIFPLNIIHVLNLLKLLKMYYLLGVFHLYVATSLYAYFIGTKSTLYDYFSKTYVVASKTDNIASEIMENNRKIDGKVKYFVFAFIIQYLLLLLSKYF